MQRSVWRERGRGRGAHVRCAAALARVHRHAEPRVPGAAHGGAVLRKHRRVLEVVFPTRKVDAHHRAVARAAKFLRGAHHLRRELRRELSHLCPAAQRVITQGGAGCVQARVA